MNFIAGQKVTLIDGRYRFIMTVLGQVKEYVALYDDNYIEVFTIHENKRGKYLMTQNDGGPCVCYKFKIVL